MNKNIFSWALFRLKRMFTSMAFLPAFLALVFLALSYLMIHFDYSETGKLIKTQERWLKLKDASTARSIITVIAGGILSLTVFSFSMMMVILNQASAQMSNRVLDNIIGNRFQQLVLGCYVGTIVYSLFLLSAVRDVDAGIYVPSLSTYLLIIFAVFDIFLFIYFLHFTTQSVKYVVVIKRVYHQTIQSLKQSCTLLQPTHSGPPAGQIIHSLKTGLFTGSHKIELLALAQKHDFIVYFLHPFGTYVLKGSPLLQCHTHKQTTNEGLANQVLSHVIVSGSTSITTNYYFGFRQLTEVAVKALSPGINDPGTAVESLRSLVSLLQYRLEHFPDNVIKDANGNERVIARELCFDELFEQAILPIWDYGENDRMLQNEMRHLLMQLQQQTLTESVKHLLLSVNKKIGEAKNDE